MAGPGGAEIDERPASAERGRATASGSEPEPREGADTGSDAKDAGVEPDAQVRAAGVADDVPLVLAEQNDDPGDEPGRESAAENGAATGATSAHPLDAGAPGDAEAETHPPDTHHEAPSQADDDGADDDGPDDDATELTPLPDATITDTAAGDTAEDDGEPVAHPVGASVIDFDTPASSSGPRFVPPPYDPTSVPPYQPSEPAQPTESYEPTGRGHAGPAPEPELEPPEPVAPVPGVQAPVPDQYLPDQYVPEQYVTGAVPILEIEGGWDAVHRRRRRQTLTFLAGLVGVLVLGFVAWLTYSGVVPWPFGGTVSVAQNVCTHSQPLPPKKITVRVFNGSSRNGLAGQVAGQLKGLGFVIKGTGNDPLETKIKTAVEIRHGENGDLAAATMVAYVLGKTKDVQDDRQDTTIDLVLGPSFARLHSKGELKKSLAAVTSTLPMTCPAGVTPPPATPTPAGTPKARVTPRPSPTPKR